MRSLVAFCLAMMIQAATIAVWSDDIAPLNAPENDLIAHVLAQAENGSLQLAPLTRRVWSDSELLRLSEQSDTLPARAVRRLLLGDKAPEARVLVGLALLTGEESPRLAWRLSGVYSLTPRAEMVFSLDTTRSLFERRPIMPWVYTLQWRLHTAFGEWRIGQAPLRWGGGYSGAMLLSDTPPPLLHMDYRQGWHLGKRLGTWRYEQMAAMFEEEGARRYVMARRLSRALSPRWEISLAEAFKANKLPAGLSALVLPFYLYQHLFTWRLYDGNDEWFNYLAEVQLRYRFARQNLYMELLLDDLQAPRWLTRFRYTTPRKSGVLVGYHTSLPEGGQFVAEIAHTDGDPGGGTYQFKIPDNRWRYRDAVLGHPVGTNRDMLYLRLDLPLAHQGYLAVEHVNTRMSNASPDVPTGKTWTVSLYWLMGEGYTAGVRWQQDITRDGQPTRWMVQAGRVF